MKFAEFSDNGTSYLICLGCLRVGRPTWAHLCGRNWFASVNLLLAHEGKPPTPYKGGIWTGVLS